MTIANLFLLFFLFFIGCPGSESYGERMIANTNILKPGELEKIVGAIAVKKGVITVLGNEIENSKASGVGNPGDLIYRYRESNDVLLIREVIVLPEVGSGIQEVQWYVTTQARRITSVRVLNFGSERAFTLRIDVTGNEAHTIFRVPSNNDPRIMIEVYGF